MEKKILKKKNFFFFPKFPSFTEWPSYIYINKVKLGTVVKGDPKAPFSIAELKGNTLFSGSTHFTLDPFLIMLSVRQGGIKYHFWVFGMTRPEIEPKCPGPLANTLTIMPMSELIYRNHHHHHVPPARISQTLSRQFSLLFIASGRSSGLHPISSHNCCMYVQAGRPAFAWPYVGVHGMKSDEMKKLKDNVTRK